MPEFDSFIEYLFESISAVSPGFTGLAGKRLICKGAFPIKDPRAPSQCVLLSVCHRVTCLHVNFYLITRRCVCYLQPDVAGLFHWMI